MGYSFPIELFVNTPTGPSVLSDEVAKQPLPQGLNSGGAILTYGPFLSALSAFIARDSFLSLKTALASMPDRSVPLGDVQRIEIISEKHGAVYNVAHVRVHLTDGEYCSFALNTAVGPERRAILSSEFSLLEYLNDRFGPAFIPTPFFRGETVYEGEDGSSLPLGIFLAEWFEGYHEFHLSAPSSKESPIISVWDTTRRGCTLSSEQARSLYRKSAAIMTSFFDENTFQQIYPWHHAAGDFILKLGREGIDLRLITVRGYQPLVQTGSEPEERWIAIVHFLFNLSFRMRLDRIDGVGELTLAGADCVRSVMEGFLHAWEEKAARVPSLPSASEILHLLRSFSMEELLSLGELILEEGMVEEDELSIVQANLKKHTALFHEALKL